MKQSFSTSVGRVEVLIDEQSGVVSVCRFDTEGRAVAAAIEGLENTDLAGLLVHQGVPAAEANDIASTVTRTWRERARPSPADASPADASPADALPAGTAASAVSQAGERKSVLKRVYMTAFWVMFGCFLAWFAGVSFHRMWTLFLGLFVAVAVVCWLISVLTPEDSPRFFFSTVAQHDEVWSLADGPWQGVLARNCRGGIIEVARVHRGEFCRYMVDKQGRTSTVESRRVRSRWEGRIMCGGIGLFVFSVIHGVIRYGGGPAPTWSAIPAIVGFAAATVTAVRQPFPENYVLKDGSWTEIGRVEGEG